jgi:Family of unknown function (DUF6325)
MTDGPVEYLVFEFPDGNASDEVAHELADLVDKKVIRVLDAVFVTRDAAGEIASAEFDEVDGMAGFLEIDAQVGGLIGSDDVTFVGGDLDPDSSAVLLLVEDLWAAPLAHALDRCGAQLTEGVRIPQDLVDAAVAALPTS